MANAPAPVGGTTASKEMKDLVVRAIQGYGTIDLLTAIAALETQATRKDRLQVPAPRDTAALDILDNLLCTLVVADTYLDRDVTVDAIKSHVAALVQAEREIPCPHCGKVRHER